MLATLEFVMVSCLFANLVAFRGAQVWNWLKGAEKTVVDEAKKVETFVVSETKKL